MPHLGRRWYLNPELRLELKAAVEAYDGSYRGVGKRLGISYASIHRLVAGVTKSSWVVPDLLKLLDLEAARGLLELNDELTDEQIAWLKLLDDLLRAGKDPRAVEENIRQLAAVPSHDKHK